MQVFIKEFQIGDERDKIKGSEAIIYPFKNYMIKRITPRGIVTDPVDRKRLYELHQFLKNINHPYIAPVLDIKAKKDEKGNYEYIEIIKPRYNKLNKNESDVMWDFYLTIKEHYNSGFLKKAMDNFILTHEEKYKDNLKGIADATLYLKEKGVIKYLMKHFNEPLEITMNFCISIGIPFAPSKGPWVQRNFLPLEGKKVWDTRYCF